MLVIGSVLIATVIEIDEYSLWTLRFMYMIFTHVGIIQQMRSFSPNLGCQILHPIPSPEAESGIKLLW